jgi:opacity protein-like surface antigen
MRFQTLAAATLTALAVPGISLAEFNYTSAEFNFVDVDVDFGPFSVDGDGYSIGGTYPVADNFFIGASWESYDFDGGVDGEWLEIGGGYFRMLDDDLDFVATLSLVDAEVSSGYGSADDDGIAIGGGIRAQLADTIEVDALLKYVDMDKGDNDTGIEVRGRYYISDEFAVQLKLSTVNDFDTLSIGVRGEF